MQQTSDASKKRSKRIAHGLSPGTRLSPTKLSTKSSIKSPERRMHQSGLSTLEKSKKLMEVDEAAKMMTQSALTGVHNK